MKPVFELMTFTDKDEKGQAGVSIGINVKIGGNETIHPITSVCDSQDALESEVRALNENLENLTNRAKTIFERSSTHSVIELQPDMEPEEIWEALSSIADAEIFADCFNNLHEAKRKEVADYVLTRCNIFSGKGAVFSSRYNNESSLLE